jgi:dipeptidyl aminopeptidase/acylaminoacyl peptidase
MPKKAKPLSVQTLWKIQRIGGVALAPDGATVVCTVTTPSMAENRSRSQLWLLPTAEGKARALTHCGDKDGQAAWSPQGERIAFIAKREQEGKADKTPQLYVIAADGGEARRVSDFGPGVEGFRWMPDGQHIVFVAWVWPELKGATAQDKRYQSWSERKETGYATSENQYRYFDHNLPEGRVAHLLMLNVRSGRIHDLFEGSSHELPREDPGAGSFDISPSGQHIVFACDPAAKKASGQRQVLVELALRTKRFTTLVDHARWDFTAPRYSPDGQGVAVLASETARHHMALAQLAFVQRGTPWHGQAMPWTLDVQAPLQWSADGRRVHFTAEERGRCHGFVFDIDSAQFRRTVSGGWVHSLGVAGPANDERVVTAQDCAHHPVRVLAHDAKGSRRLETFNDELLATVALGELREVSFKGALGDEVQMWLVQPPRFKPTKKYPLLHVIHGGPYAAAGDTFNYRWNPHLLASRGHVVAQVNYHGSSGFGFDFRSSITGQLGQLESQDLEAASDWLLARPWADAEHLYASGGSYGGYLVAWMNGHQAPWPQGLIRAYVCHAGVFDRVATWSADSYTQRHQDMGATYWADAAKVHAQSPMNFAAQMNTPTLVTHGAQDFRVPDHNGLAYYNTLKARGVDARLVWFADENHWVLKPRNSKQWYGEFFDWLQRHSGKPAVAATPPATL